MKEDKADLKQDKKMPAAKINGHKRRDKIPLATCQASG